MSSKAATVSESTSDSGKNRKNGGGGGSGKDAKASKKLGVVVVGGGMIGSACARHLSTVMPEARIAVIAPEEPKVPYAEHDGMFASHYDEGRVTRILDPDAIWARLAQDSIDRYRDLEKESGIEFFHECGYACIGAAQHSSYLASVQSVADAAGVEYECLHAEQLFARFPAMVKPSPDTSAAEAESSGASHEAGLRALLQTTRAGYLSPRKMVDAMLRVCAGRGVRIVNDTATSVSLDSAGSGKAEVRLAGGGVMYADKVVVCTGAFTKPELTDGVQLPLDMEGRTVVFADVTDLMATSPELQLDRLPSVIKALSSSDGGSGEGDEGAAIQGGEGRPELQTRKGKDREQGPLYDLYCLPPVKYADGRWYIKIGTGDFPNKLRTVEDVVAWFKGPPAGPDVAMLTRELLSLYPVLESCERSATNCALTYTPHGRPIIDWVRDGVLAVAVGGNGAAAKSADEIGRLAAQFVAGNPDTTYDMKAFQLPPLSSTTTN